ncbi:MAG: hypothetical protein AB1414_21120, partial [bacterium]
MQIKLIKVFLIILILSSLFLPNLSFNLTNNQIQAEEIKHLLRVYKTGLGVITTDPVGIDCGDDCSESYLEGTQVKLTATADDGWVLTGWRFDKADSIGAQLCELAMLRAINTRNPVSLSCTIPIKRPIDVYITFERGGVIEVVKTGSGTVISSPTGIDCGCNCQGVFLGDPGFVTLTAIPASGATFIGWEGDCSGIEDCLLYIDHHHRNVIARFSKEGQYMLTVNKIGSGTITSSPLGINCGDDCNESYENGTRVNLTVKADPGWSIAQLKFRGSCNRINEDLFLLRLLGQWPQPILSYTFTLNIIEPETIAVIFSPIALPPSADPKKWSFAIITDIHMGRGYPDYNSQGYEDSGEGEDYY